MERLFTASSVHKVGQKGRVSVPSSYRRVLEALGAVGAVYLVPSLVDAGAIEGYAPVEFNRLADRILRMHPASPQRRVLQQSFIGTAELCELDSTGRLVLPPAFRALAGIGAEAKFVGAGDKFQIWEPAACGSALDALVAEIDPAEALAALPWDDEAPA